MRFGASRSRIARELSVSAKTVSNAYNHPDQLSPRRRERIFAAAQRLGYAGPDAVARGLRRGRAGIIGVLYDSPLSYAFNDAAAISVLSGISSIAEPGAVGLSLLPGSPAGTRDPAAVTRATVDGLIAYSLASDDPVLRAAIDRGLPLVIIDQPRIPTVPWVGIDDTAAAAMAADHLLHLGHRRVAIVSFALSRAPEQRTVPLAELETAVYEVTRRRLAGYARTFEAAGLPWETVPVREGTANDEDAGKEGAAELLALDPGLTALLCLSDRLALGAMIAVHERGLNVPGDVSIVGFDDAAFATTTDPPLTTVRQPHEEKGVAAARTLGALMRGEAVRLADQLPFALAVRSSTAPPRAR